MAKAGVSKLRSKLVGVGSCAPPTRVTNVDLEDLVDTTDEWIAQRTGIRSRHLLAPGETMSELGGKAAEGALAMAGVAAEDVDLVIFATSSADDLFGDAANVAMLVGATNAVAFDLTAACSGFLFGINTASQFLHNGAAPPLTLNPEPLPLAPTPTPQPRPLPQPQPQLPAPTPTPDPDPDPTP